MLLFLLKRITYKTYLNMLIAKIGFSQGRNDVAGLILRASLSLTGTSSPLGFPVKARAEHTLWQRTALTKNHPRSYKFIVSRVQ